MVLVSNGKLKFPRSFGFGRLTQVQYTCTYPSTRVPWDYSYSRVEIIWGIAPVRPGPYYGYLSPSGAGPKQALSLLY